jgi:hypothetical protein
MAIKNVQHDTMSHFITDRATTFGLFNEALTLLYGAHDIYHSNEAEVNPRRTIYRSCAILFLCSFQGQL